MLLFSTEQTYLSVHARMRACAILVFVEAGSLVGRVLRGAQKLLQVPTDSIQVVHVRKHAGFQLGAEFLLRH
jgi:hypothetical protein